jgi:hypothetical protein
MVVSEETVSLQRPEVAKNSSHDCSVPSISGGEDCKDCEDFIDLDDLASKKPSNVRTIQATLPCTC